MENRKQENKAMEEKKQDMNIPAELDEETLDEVSGGVARIVASEKEKPRLPIPSIL